MAVAGHHVPVWYDEATGPADGEVSVWNAAAGRFESAPVVGGAVPDGTYVGGVILAGPGIDYTGVTDSTAAVQAKIDDAKAAKLPVIAPFGGFLKLTDTIDCRCTLINGNLNHLDDFKGIIGPGREALKFLQYTNNIPIFRFSNRYFTVRGFTAKFNTPQTPAMTAGNVFDFEDMVFFCTFEDLLIENGYLGWNHKDGDKTDVGAAWFSNTVQDVRFLNNQYIHWRMSAAEGANSGGTGGHYSNIYMSSPSRDRMYRAIERFGHYNDVFSQINIEQTTFEDAAIHTRGGDSLNISSMHLEGVRFPCASGERAIIATADQGVSKINIGIDNTFIGAHKVSGITRSGTTATATIDLFDHPIAGHGLRVGDTVVVDGANEAEYNGTFTVTGIPTTTTATYTVAGTPATPATLAAGVEYITMALGAAFGSGGISIIKPNSGAETIDMDLRIRDVRVTGKNAGARSTMFRFATGAEANARVKIRNLSTRGQILYAQLPSAVDIVAFSRTTNVATAYTRVPHRLRVGDKVFVNTAVSGFSASAAVVAVPGPHTFTYNSVAADAALARATSSSLLMKTYGTTFKARTSNVATLTLDSTHSLKVGHRVRIANIAGYTGTDIAISAVTADTISYVLAGADEVPTASTIGAVMLLDAGVSLSLLTEPASSLVLEEADWLFSGCEALNLGTVAAGAAATQTTTHYGVRVGDRIDWSQMSVGLVPDGLRVSAYASAADTITWRGHNPTAGDIVSGAILARYRIGRN